uniref:(+)-delta-cadinene synthase isozyme C2 n=1 Tax=Aegilops tauschii TaxID=37682 RepID=M8BZG9_AEGTA
MYSISDVFLKFKDDQGNFASNDVNSLLALYNATYLRIRGEEMLDDAVTFTKNRLQSMVEHLEPRLAEEVLCTLETPHLKRVERVETRRYIAVYEKKATRDEDILEFAKFDFNILQTLYCEELKALTITTEESNIFTAAMQRWDAHVVEQLPAYLKALYINILKTTNDIEEVLKCQENKNAEFVKKLREQGSNHMVSTVQTCTIEHGIMVVEANEKLKVIIEEAWMDIVHERLLKKIQWCF